MPEQTSTRNQKVFYKALLTALILLIGSVVGYFAPEINAFDFGGNSRATKQKAQVVSVKSINIDPNVEYAVTDVVDGDTLKANVNGEEITVRLLGVDTPEVVDPRKTVQCYGPEASAKSKELMKGSKVKLVLNPNREKTDKYGRVLAYVYRSPDGLFLNDYLVANGYAHEMTVGKKYQFQVLFRADMQKAKEAGLGLWTACATSTSAKSQ